MEAERKLAETQENLSATVNKLAVAKRKLKDSLFQLDLIKHDDSLVKVYLAIPHFLYILKRF